LRQSPSQQTIWCILKSKSTALVAAVFVDFPKNTCNFLHKNKLDIVRRVQLLTGRRPMRSFPPGAVATISPWKSAPVLPTQLKLQRSNTTFCRQLKTLCWTWSCMPTDTGKQTDDCFVMRYQSPSRRSNTNCYCYCYRRKHKTLGRIAVAHGSFSRIRQVTAMCTPWFLWPK